MEKNNIKNIVAQLLAIFFLVNGRKKHKEHSACLLDNVIKDLEESLEQIGQINAGTYIN